MWAEPKIMRKMYHMHKLGYEGTPMNLILSASTGGVQYDLLMNWYKLKGIERPCIQSYKPFTEEEMRILKEDRENGVPYTQIAEKIGHPVGSTRDTYYKLNPCTKRRTIRPFTAAEKVLIRKLREEDKLAYRVIAKMLHRHHANIMELCKDIEVKTLKERLNEVSKNLYGYHFSSLRNWKDGEERQRKVREIVEREKSLSSLSKRTGYPVLFFQLLKVSWM
jgi:hypothetical protein